MTSRFSDSNFSNEERLKLNEAGTAAALLADKANYFQFFKHSLFKISEKFYNGK